MKRIIIGLLACAFAATLGSCMKETIPTDRATSKQVGENPQGIVNGLQSWMVRVGTVTTSHWDFGYPSMMLMNEMCGQDIATTPSNYEQFGNWLAWSYMSQDYITVQFYWNFLYGLAFNANLAITNGKPEGTAAQKQALATCLTYRAFAYHHLVQYYQSTYKGNETKPAVPIVKETTTEAQAANNPRATVQAVYDFILADLMLAEQLMGTNKTTTKADVDINVIQGMLARVYLCMENFPKAKEYAAKARTGFALLTQSAFLNPNTGFNDMSASSWMWALHLTDTDRAVTSGIINFTSQMSNDYNPGYLGGTPLKRLIAVKLYEAIPDNDWRKAAWLAAPAVAMNGTTALPKYASRKFRPYQGQFNNSKQTTDFPLMRAEEMALIEIEATAMGGDLAGAKTLMNTFLASRSTGTNMVTNATTAAQLRDEVWMQRRIELWGEGHTFFDLKRLNKGITRSYVGTNFFSPYRYNTVGTPPWYNICIVRNEITNNEGISQEQNNPAFPKPDDIDPATL